MRCHLLRHGAVRPPRPGAFYGCLDVPLAPAGEQEAARAAAALAGVPLGAVWSSPLERARYGARLLAEPRGLSIGILPDFRELDRGAWAGRTPEELRRERPGELAALARSPGTFRPAGGESLADLRRRVLRAWAQVREAALALGPNRELAVVAHLWPIRAVAAAVLGLEVREWPCLAVPTGSITTVAVEPDGRDRLLALGRRPEAFTRRASSPA